MNAGFCLGGACLFRHRQASDDDLITRGGSLYTAHEIDRTGTVVRVYHRTDAGSSWTHPVGQTYRYWTELGPDRRKTEGSHGWVQMRCQCPVVRPIEGQTSASEAD